MAEGRSDEAARGRRRRQRRPRLRQLRLLGRDRLVLGGAQEDQVGRDRHRLQPCNCPLPDARQLRAVVFALIQTLRDDARGGCAQPLELRRRRISRRGTRLHPGISEWRAGSCRHQRVDERTRTGRVPTDPAVVAALASRRIDRERPRRRRRRYRRLPIPRADDTHEGHRRSQPSVASAGRSSRAAPRRRRRALTRHRGDDVRRGRATTHLGRRACSALRDDRDDDVARRGVASRREGRRRVSGCRPAARRARSDGAADRDRARDAAVDRTRRATRPASKPAHGRSPRSSSLGVREGLVRPFLESRLDVAGLAAMPSLPPRVVVVVLPVVVSSSSSRDGASARMRSARPWRLDRRAGSSSARAGGIVSFAEAFTRASRRRDGAVSVCGPLKLAQGASTRVAARKRRGGHHARGNRRAIRRVNPRGGRWGGRLVPSGVPRRVFRAARSCRLERDGKVNGIHHARPPPSVRCARARLGGWEPRAPTRAATRSRDGANAWRSRGERTRRRRRSDSASPQPLPPTHAPRAARDFRPCAEKRPVAKSPSPPPSPPLPRASSIPPASPRATRVRYTTIPTRTTHLQVHCFDNKGAYTADEREASSPRMPPSAKSTAGATRRRMILHDRLARTIDGWRYELDEERAKPGRRATPGATAVDELVQPRGYTARRGGGQQRRPSPAEPADPAPQRPAQGTPAEQTRRRRRRGLHRAPGAVAGIGERGRGRGTDIGHESIQVARVAGSKSNRKSKSKTRGDGEHGGQASRGGAREATGLRRRVHAVAHQGPERGRGGQRDGAAAHLAARRGEAPRSFRSDLLRSSEQGIPRRLRETPMRPGAVETKRVATAREAAAKPAMVFGRNPGGGGGGEGGFDERVRLAAAGATAHSRILLLDG